MCWKRRFIRLERIYHAGLCLLVRLPLLPWRLRQYVLGTLGIVVFIVVVRYWWLGRALQHELDEIAERGLPVTVEQLSQFSKLPTDADDITQPLLDLLRRVEKAKDGLKLKQSTLYDELFTRGYFGLERTIDVTTIPPPLNDWPNLQLATDYLSHYDSELDSLERLLTAKCAVRFELGQSPWADRIEFDQIQAVRELLRLRAFVRAHHGHMTGLVRAIQSLFRLADTLRQEPTSDAQSLRLNTILDAAEVIQMLIATVNFDDSDLVDFQDQLRRVDLNEALYLSNVGDLAIGLAWFYEQGTRNPFSYYAKPRGQLVWRRFLALTLFPHAEKRTFVRHMAECIADAQQKRAYEDRPFQNYYQPFNHLFASDISDTSDVFTDHAVYSMSRTSDRDGYLARLRIADTAIALERYRRANKAWPRSLRDLLPTFLDELPIDPFCDKPLKYIRCWNEFRVYSVDHDGQDNSGEALFFPHDLVSRTFASLWQDPILRCWQRQFIDKQNASKLVIQPRRYEFADARCSIEFPLVDFLRLAYRAAYGRSIQHELICRIKYGEVRISWIDLDDEYIERRGQDRLLREALNAANGVGAKLTSVRIFGLKALDSTTVNQQQASIGQFRFPEDIMDQQIIRVIAFFRGARLYTISIRHSQRIHKSDIEGIRIDETILDSFRFLRPKSSTEKEQNR